MVYILDNGHKITRLESFVLRYIGLQSRAGKGVTKWDLYKKFGFNRIINIGLRRKIKEQLEDILSVSFGLVNKNHKIYLITEKGVDVVNNLSSNPYPRLNDYVTSRLAEYL